ncbi:MAG TPA: hypothetical protein GXZ58_03625 [Bacilli bacterium]|nr:hypothetical protein [Bacilli bacterium]
MLQAVSSKGKRVTLALLPRSQIIQLKQAKTPFYCPVCKTKLIMKAGTQMIAHFAHKSLQNCPNRASGEGVYHERGKLDLFTWLTNQGFSVQLEHYIPEIKQRADLIVQFAQKRLAIEYQCATIPLKEILARTRGYQSIGITPLWILGGNRMRRLSKQGLYLTPTEQSFLHQFNNDIYPKLYFYCPDSKQFARYDLICLTGKSRSVGQLKFKRLASIRFEQFFKTEQLSIFTPEWLSEKKRFRLKLPHKMNQTEKQFREWLYLNQLFPSLMSSWIGLPVNGQWTMKVSVWTWQTYLCYDFLNHFPQFSSKQLNGYMQRFRKQKLINFPMLSQKNDPVEAYLSYFLQVGKIIKVGETYQVRGSIGQYQTIDEALAKDVSIQRMLAQKCFYR